MLPTGSQAERVSVFAQERSYGARTLYAAVEYVAIINDVIFSLWSAIKKSKEKRTRAFIAIHAQLEPEAQESQSRDRCISGFEEIRTQWWCQVNLKSKQKHVHLNTVESRFVCLIAG